MNRKTSLFVLAIVVCFIAAMMIGPTAFAQSADKPASKCGNGGNGNGSSAVGAPSALKLVSKTDTTAALSWAAPKASRGHSSVKGYNIYRDGKLAGTTTDTSFTDTGLTPNTYYTWTVKAYDAYKRQSEASGKLTTATQIIIREDVTWTVDNVPASINGGLIVTEEGRLQIDPGVAVKIKPAQSVIVYGTVNAGGTADAMVVFTVAKESKSACSRSAVSYWDTIKVAQGGSFTGDYVQITYGSTLATVQGMFILNNSEIAYAKTKGIFVDTTGEFDGFNDKIHNCCTVTGCRGIDTKGQVNLSSSSITDCPGTGVLVEPTGTFNGTTVTISNCGKGVEIQGNINFVLSGVSACHYGLYFNTATFSGVILNSFMGNDQYGVYNAQPDAVTIDASSNYWGSPNGPSVYDEATQTWSDGGDKVSSGVKYDNWLTEAAQ